MSIYHHKLVHAVTEYDRKQMTKRGYNVYALAQYLEAVNAAEELIDKGVGTRRAFVECFNGRLLDVVLKSIGEPKQTIEEARGGAWYRRSSEEMGQ